MNLHPALRGSTSNRWKACKSPASTPREQGTHCPISRGRRYSETSQPQHQIRLSEFSFAEIPQITQGLQSTYQHATMGLCVALHGSLDRHFGSKRLQLPTISP